MAEPNVDDFWKRVLVAQTDECWEWQGPRYQTGYGRVGRGSYAHRTAWSLANGREIPQGLVVMHSCDNPPCVNPAHLSVGTHADNVRDRDAKGRGRWRPRGTPQIARRLISEEVIAAIRDLRAAGLTTRKVAAQLGVSTGTVYHYSTGPRAKDYPHLGRVA